jgi:drug/metabolite transporter (DMT)-like permease
VRSAHGRPPSTEFLTGGLIAFLAAVGFASGPIWAVSLYDRGYEWSTLLAWRFAVAAIVMWLIVLVVPRLRAELAALPSHMRIKLLGLGLVYLGTAAAYYAALTIIPASVAVLVVMSPAFIAVISWFVGLRLGMKSWLALLAAMSGAALAAFGPANGVDLTGIGLAVLASLIYAVWAILAARVAGERKGHRVRGVSSPLAVALMFTATATGAALVAFAIGARRPSPPPDWMTLVLLAGFALFPTVMGTQGSYASAARIGASRASIVLASEPMLTVGLAAVFLHELVTPFHIVAGALVVTAVVLLGSEAGGRSPRSAGAIDRD